MTKQVAVLSLMLLSTGAVTAGAQGTTPKSATVKQKAASHAEVEQLNERIDRLEKLLQQMQQQLQARDEQLATAKKQAVTAQTEVELAAQQQRARSEEILGALTKNKAEIETINATMSDMQIASTGVVDTLVSVQKQTNQFSETPSIRFMGIDLKPGGFLAGETVSRQHAVGGDINTPFASIPFSGQTASTFSEFNGSGRQSRLSLLAEGQLSHATLRGYYEADFLSAGSTSNDNQSNSYSLRQRQVWAQAALYNGLTVTGGQMWSLATEYGSGLTNGKESIPLTIDAQYNVGFTWERQYGFRVTKTLGPKTWVGIAVEEPQTLNLGGHNLLATVDQQAGSSGGLYNPGANYSYNYAPDLIAKVAFEPHIGHFEVFAVGRFFRARVFPNAVSLNGGTVSTTPTAGAYTSKTQGGGLGLNARVPLFSKRLEIGGHILAGNGIGRYSSSTLADATEHADGSLELLTGGSALTSVKWKVTPRFDVYGYYGGEYAKRAYYATGLTVLNGVNVGQPVLTGYGAPTNNVSGCHTEVAPVTSSNGGGFVPGAASLCNADTRNIQEGTAGYWFRFYQGSKGTLQQGFQYSYLVRHTWQGIGDPLSNLGGSPKAINNMWFTSFRYYLPQ